MTVEIRVEDVVGACHARGGRTDRIEIYTDLSCDDLTPALDEVATILGVAPAGGVQMLVHPRLGDFVYTREEVDYIAFDIVIPSSIGRGSDMRLGFATGIITRDGRVDANTAVHLRDTVGDMPLTFHRSFDQVADQDRGLDVLIEPSYGRVLTAGGDPAVAQPDALIHLIERGGDDVIILAPGGLRAHNVAEAVVAPGARGVHICTPRTSGTDQAEVEQVITALYG